MADEHLHVSRVAIYKMKAASIYCLPFIEALNQILQKHGNMVGSRISHGGSVLGPVIRLVFICRKFYIGKLILVLQNDIDAHLARILIEDIFRPGKLFYQYLNTF